MTDTIPQDPNERLRSDVREQDLPNLERRVAHLEHQMGNVNVIIAGRLAALDAHYAHMTDVLERFVHRFEFTPVRALLHVTVWCLVLLTLVVVWKLTR
jgi:hypothetical protein